MHFAGQKNDFDCIIFGVARLAYAKICKTMPEVCKIAKLTAENARIV